MTASELWQCSANAATIRFILAAQLVCDFFLAARDRRGLRQIDPEDAVREHASHVAVERDYLGERRLTGTGHALDRDRLRTARCRRTASMDRDRVRRTDRVDEALEQIDAQDIMVRERGQVIGLSESSDLLAENAYHFAECVRLRTWPGPVGLGFVGGSAVYPVESPQAKRHSLVGERTGFRKSAAQQWRDRLAFLQGEPQLLCDVCRIERLRSDDKRNAVGAGDPALDLDCECVASTGHGCSVMPHV
jgi:hypothetical protein